MKPSLVPGLEHELRFTVPVAKTVPRLYPESPAIASMHAHSTSPTMNPVANTSGIAANPGDSG